MTEFLSENAYLACIDKHFTNHHPHMLQGRGDDCAELMCPERMAISSDLFLEDIHFRQAYFAPGEIGHKALAVNLSDLASAGATPLGFSLGVMTPQRQNAAFWDALLGGMANLANKFNLALTGGDLSKAPFLGFSITIWGGGGPNQKAPFLQRGAGRPGDAIFIVGELGLARIGLLSLEKMGTDAKALYPAATAAHLRPLPQLSAGQTIARMGGIGLMDLSDGLARDLPRLLGMEKGSGLGASLTLSENSLHEEILSYALANGEDAIKQAVTGGEEYALIGTCPANRLEELVHNVPQTIKIGEVTSHKGILLNGLPLEDTGFDHFSR